MRRALSFAAVAAILCVAGDRASAQMAPPGAPTHSHSEHAQTAGTLDYQTLYGPPEFRAIDDDNARPWPTTHSIRTIATFMAFEDSTTSGATAGRTLEYYFSNQYTPYVLCGLRHCIAFMPVPEMNDFFRQTAAGWLHREVEVKGAIDDVRIKGDTNVMFVTTFQVWSISPYEGGGFEHKKGEKGSTLEQLVSGPDALAGRPVTVTGVFRGANLFDDLPKESQRDTADWVLSDGAYSVWVTGKPPRGSGWSLDPSARSDCHFRLEVQGRIETVNGYVYLRARRVTLLGRTASEPETSRQQ